MRAAGMCQFELYHEQRRVIALQYGDRQQREGGEAAQRARGEFQLHLRILQHLLW